METRSTARALLPAGLKERGIVHRRSGADAFVLIAPSTGALRQCTAMIVSREAAFNTLLTLLLCWESSLSRRPELLTAEGITSKRHLKEETLPSFRALGPTQQTSNPMFKPKLAPGACCG